MAQEASDVCEAVGVVRVNLSIQHLLAGARFSRQVADLERQYAGEVFGPFWEEIFAYCSSTVAMSVAALEAYINEFFFDCGNYLYEYDENVIKCLWEALEREKALNKYDYALILRKKTPFEKDQLIYEDARYIIRLRNALIHFNPECANLGTEHKKIGANIRSKVTKSTFFQKQEPLFPRAWATHSATTWVVNSIYNYIVEFENKAEIPSRITKFKDRIVH